MNEPVMIVLKNGLADVNLILTGLGELPAKMSFHMIKEIEAQYAAQAKPVSAPAGSLPETPPDAL